MSGPPPEDPTDPADRPSPAPPPTDQPAAAGARQDGEWITPSVPAPPPVQSPWPAVGAGVSGPTAPRRRGRGLVVGLAALVVLLLVAVGVGVTAILSVGAGGDDDAGSGTTTRAASYVTQRPDGSVAVARPGVTAPVLEIYEDFQCPICRAFEATSGGTVTGLATKGRVRVIYRPIASFADEPRRSSSARAAMAAACAPAADWLAFHWTLFQAQPTDAKTGFTTSRLLALGRQAGISDPSFTTCVTGRITAPQVAAASSAALAAGVEVTPTLVLDGRRLGEEIAFSPSALTVRILDAHPRGNPPGSV